MCTFPYNNKLRINILIEYFENVVKDTRALPFI
jgi:hypothetical protein